MFLELLEGWEVLFSVIKNKENLGGPTLKVNNIYRKKLER